MEAKWTMIILTCQNKNSAQAFQKELDLRQKKNLIAKDIILLAIEDPKEKVGSGGATLNALLIAAEHLSARQHYTVITGDVFHETHILIMHQGRNFPFDPCGRAFVTIQDAACHKGLKSNLDYLLEMLTKQLAVFSPPGVWICSTDMFIDLPKSYVLKWTKMYDACMISMLGSVEYAKNHGVLKLSESNQVQDILYCADEEEIKKYSRQNDSVALVSGIVYLSQRVCESLLFLQSHSPLDCCTYMGIDSGAHSLQLSLFFDILLGMASEISEEDFLSGNHSRIYAKKNFLITTVEQNKTMLTARKIIWQELRHYTLNAVLLEEAQHIYLAVNLLPADYHDTFLKIQTLLKKQDCLSSEKEENSAVINSILDSDITVPSGCIILHSHLDHQISFGSRCFIAGIQKHHLKIKGKNCHLGSGIFLQSFLIHSKMLPLPEVLTVVGYKDNLMCPFLQVNCTFCNQPISEFLQRTGILPADLWSSNLPPEQWCLLNARLFSVFNLHHQVGLEEILWLLGHNQSETNLLERWHSSWRLSLEDIISYIDVEAELHRRRDIYYELCQRHLKDNLLKSRNVSSLPYFQAASVDGFQHQLLETLHKVIIECKSPSVAARTLESIADLLGCMAGTEGGLRSGPAGNKAWEKAFRLLEAEDIVNGVEALKKECQRWLDRPYLLIRAARHYEGAAQILIRQAVMSAKQFVFTFQDVLPEINKWIFVDCPARIDLSGGWTDTPPITYEHGGVVVNAAILVDGKRPIGAKARRIPETKLVLAVENEIITVSSMEDLLDYKNPQAPGALLKAAVICANVIDIKTASVSLQDQLLNRYGSGIELHTFSSLPQGSGLGTSSILAGAAIAALHRVSGQSADTNSLIHAVLCLEQMLTTGGGWQDQVGGLIGGFKLSLCKPQLPVHVEVHLIDCNAEVIEKLNSHILLIYTGKVRLAKNLLQNVIRNWYARDSTIVENCNALVKNAQQCAEALKRGDLESIGSCLNKYWNQKKVMAPGCEPATVRQIMDHLASLVYGQLLVGAGGGGFLCILTRQPNAQSSISNALKNLPGLRKISVHSVLIDENGMQTIQE